MSKEPIADYLAELLGVVKRTSDFQKIIKKLNMKELRYLIWKIEEKQGLRNPYIGFAEAFKAYKEGKRIRCTYGPTEIRFNPEAGIDYRFYEKWITDGEWEVEGE